jgi:hypothetical protein
MWMRLVSVGLCPAVSFRLIRLGFFSRRAAADLVPKSTDAGQPKS